MCNRFCLKATVSDIRETAQSFERDMLTTPETDNLPVVDAYPDRDAPVLKQTPDGKGLELASMRWGFPKAAAKQKSFTTNIRNLDKPWWQNVNRPYLMQPEYRCLVPFTAFAEPPYRPTWFGVPGRDLAFFAGIWRPWSGKRNLPMPGKSRRVPQESDWNLFAFLTTEANSIVRPVHKTAMPVILTDQAECQEWLAGGAESLRLQRPLPDDQLSVVSDPV